ncbi:MAG: S41 family peptidase [Candidatus Saccharibacteria bacterium]|nr:S41 family peptidase [Candidatus Saccharibacteria bacterium]
MAKHKWSARKINLGSCVIIVAIFTVIGWLVGYNWTAIANFSLPYISVGNSQSQAMNWSALNEVYAAILDNYDGEIDKTAMIEGAKAGMAAALGDKYTVYMTAQEASDFSDSLHGEVGAGIGVVISEQDGYVRIVRTTPDNPARKVGLLAGDIMYKVDGEEVYTLDAEGVSNKLRGAAGTEVEVTIVRDGKEKTYKLKREEINNVSADISYEKDAAVILVTRFDTDTGAKVIQFAKEAKAKGCKKVIIDLRNNGGGYVSAAVEMLGLWIDGQNVVTQKSGATSFGTATAHGNAILAETETIVLVNGSTASASEIVAGALKDYGKAKLIGAKTYGKGVVQTMVNLSAGSMLKVTSAHWYTPNGTSINGEGLEPDEKVERTYEQINKGEDPQMKKALEK